MPYMYRRRNRPPGYRRRRNAKKRYYKRQRTRLGKPSGGLRQSVYLFKRRHTEIIQLNTQTLPAGWSQDGTQLFKTFEYRLNDLVNFADFTSLFSLYKLTAVKTTFIFANTNSTTQAASSSAPMLTNPNTQIIVWYNRHPQGQVPTLDRAFFEENTASKRRLGLNGGKPINFYTPLKQSNMIYESATGTDYTLQYPKWISTQEANAPHYGSNVMLERADGEIFAGDSNNYQKLRIESTYYIACKAVS